MAGLIRKAIVFAVSVLLAVGVSAGQSRHSNRANDLEGYILSVTAKISDEKNDPILIDNLHLYENGVEQKIKNFSFDPSPARIVLLVDNSKTLPVDVDKLKQVAMEFAYEIFDGDQLFVIAFDEKPEIVQEWTDDAKKMEASLALFRKKGNPHLFDAMDSAVREILLPLMPGTRKTAVVVIGDGLDRGSKTQFAKILGDLQNENITVYSLQLPDRTGGAYRRDQPKAGAVISQLTEGTGGRAFPISEAQAAAKAICDELRRNRYLLSYMPVNTSTYDVRAVFLVADEGINVRTKNAQPPNVK
ncbi:MAG: VWA domain-containing protein [Blastocatellia bacterium]